MSNPHAQRVLVTGAAAGIGLAISRKLRSLGTIVVMCDKDVPALDAAVRGLGDNGQEAIAVAGDITDTATIARVAEVAGPLDGLVNCAGIYPVTSLLDLSADEWDRVLSLNLRTPFLLTQAVARRMIADKRGGSIVNISSTASTLARPGIAHYGAVEGGPQPADAHSGRRAGAAWHSRQRHPAGRHRDRNGAGDADDTGCDSRDGSEAGAHSHGPPRDARGDRGAGGLLALSSLVLLDRRSLHG